MTVRTRLDLSAPVALRLRHLSSKIYALGPKPLYELLCEIVAGSDPASRIETYAKLHSDYGEFIHENGGSDLGPNLRLVRDERLKDEHEAATKRQQQ
jgi:hypothetical protein